MTCIYDAIYQDARGMQVSDTSVRIRSAPDKPLNFYISGVTSIFIRSENFPYTYQGPPSICGGIF